MSRLEDFQRRTPLLVRDIPLLLELADTQHVLRQVQAHDELERQKNGSSKTVMKAVADGLGVLTKPEYGQKLNRVMGLGLSKHHSASPGIAADQIEKLFEQARTPVSIHMAPFATPFMHQMLKDRGYIPDGSLNVYYIEPSNARLISPPSERPLVIVQRVYEGRANDFRDASVEGFLSGGRSPSLLSLLATLALQRYDTTKWLAYVDGKLAASAAMSELVIPASLESFTDAQAARGHFYRVAQLYLDSTLPQFRGQGVHAALIRRRIKQAQEDGYDLVMMIARPGSGSARNAVRVGMKLAYEKQILRN